MKDKTQPEALALADEARELMPPDVLKLWAAEAAYTIRRLLARIAELEAARFAYASEFEPNSDGYPDVGSIHANIRAMKAKLASSAAPAGAAPKAPPVCPDCNGTGVDGDVGNDGRVVDCVCGGCAGSGKARFLGKCPDGMRCLHGCLVDEQCHLDRRAMLAASPTPPAEQQAQPGAVYAELPDFDSGDEPIWEAVFNWKAATPGSDAHKKADAVSGAVINALRDFADRTHALRMEQAAPKAAPESFLDGADVQDESGVLAYYSREAVLACITAALESVAAPKAAPQQKAHHLTQALTDPENQPNQYGVEFGMSGQQMHFKIGNQLFRLAYEPDDQQEFEFMKRMLIHAFSTFTPDVKAAPQPAPQGETNAQLDTDSNSPTPGQQRDVAGPVAVGQPVGHGSDSTAGDPSAQRNKLLTVAERNIRSFLRSAVFKSESDREAALNCVDVLWEAARAPASSQPAPAPLSDDAKDAAFEAVRKKLCALPRFSFFSDGYGAVRRIPDGSGSWIAFDAAHALFDPVAVDAAIAAQGDKA